ncbi:Elongator subunit elp4, partial [Coelomomyces lativittatus]
MRGGKKGKKEQGLGVLGNPLVSLINKKKGTSNVIFFYFIPSVDYFPYAIFFFLSPLVRFPLPCIQVAVFFSIIYSLFISFHLFKKKKKKKKIMLGQTHSSFRRTSSQDPNLSTSISPSTCTATTLPTSTTPPSTGHVGLKYVLPHALVPCMSTGVEALDALLGGGWPLGTLMVMQEDRFTGYAQLLLQTYVSQGLVHGHDVLVVSADELPPSLLSQCPGYEDIEPLSPPPPPPSSSMVACHSEHDETDSFMISQKSEKENSLLNADIVPVTKNEKKNGGRDRLLKKKNVEDEEEDEEEEEDVEDEEEKEDKLTIAWRYQHLPKLNQRNDFSSHPSTKKVSFQLPPSSTSSATHAPFCSKFLLTEKLTPTQIENAKDRLFYLDLTRSEDPFEDLYVYLSQLLAKKEYIRKKQPSLGGGIQHVLRIAIFSFCSPFWKRTKHFTY